MRHEVFANSNFSKSLFVPVDLFPSRLLSMIHFISSFQLWIWLQQSAAESSCKTEESCCFRSLSLLQELRSMMPLLLPLLWPLLLPPLLLRQSILSFAFPFWDLATCLITNGESQFTNIESILQTVYKR